jgi:UDP-4-amino-4,6-dideoxy-N-acetyl-beta-L-altrosamine transaminase
VIPYSRQQVSEEDIAAVVAVLRSDFLTQGEVLPAFESAFARRHDSAHAVAMGSATAALHLACLALGVGPGSRVWTSPNSFVASANCALYCGATIDFVDIDPHTRNLSVEQLAHRLEVAARQGTLPQLLIPVDFGGLPADLREMRALADRYGFRILQDASHATGASYLGRPVGSAYADAAVFSFHAIKIITTAEGGMVTTPHPDVARRLALLRSHGITRDAAAFEHPAEGPWVYEQQQLGHNARMNELQAALGLSQLSRLDALQRERRAQADRYDSLLARLPLQLPARPADRESAWHLYPVELRDTQHARAGVYARLRDAGIGVNVHYIPIHTQPFYAERGFRRGDFPASERYYARALSLPLFPGLREDEQEKVSRALHEALTR